MLIPARTQRPVTPSNRWYLQARPFLAVYRGQGGVFYLFERHSGKRESLETVDPEVARRVLHAKNEAQQQPLINR